MDLLDRQSEHHVCGLCGRRITYTDNFCSNCRRPTPMVEVEPTLLDLLDLPADTQVFLDGTHEHPFRAGGS